MTQSNAAQRAEAARLLALREGECWYPDYQDAGERLLELLPTLLADAGALAAADVALAAIFAGYDRLSTGAPRDYGDVGSLFDAVCSARANLRHARERADEVRRVVPGGR